MIKNDSRIRDKSIDECFDEHVKMYRDAGVDIDSRILKLSFAVSLWSYGINTLDSDSIKSKIFTKARYLLFLEPECNTVNQVQLFCHVVSATILIGAGNQNHCLATTLPQVIRSCCHGDGYVNYMYTNNTLCAEPLREDFIREVTSAGMRISDFTNTNFLFRYILDLLPFTPRDSNTINSPPVHPVIWMQYLLIVFLAINMDHRDLMLWKEINNFHLLCTRYEQYEWNDNRECLFNLKNAMNKFSLVRSISRTMT